MDGEGAGGPEDRGHGVVEDAEPQQEGPSALIQKRSALYSAREKLVAVEVKRESLAKQHAQVEAERERLAHAYQTALVDLNTEYGERLEAAAAENDDLRAQLDKAAVAARAMQDAHAAELESARELLEAERARLQRTAADMQALRSELAKLRHEGETEKEAAARRVAEERAAAEREAQAAEELRKSVLKLTDDKFKLWDLNDETAASAAAVHELLAAAQWQADDEAIRCTTTGCGREFSFLVRRHHCRICGRIFCNECCPRRAKVLAVSDAPIRACESCFGLLQSIMKPQGSPARMTGGGRRSSSVGVLRGTEGDEDGAGGGEGGFFVAGGKGWTNGYSAKEDQGSGWPSARSGSIGSASVGREDRRDDRREAGGDAGGGAEGGADAAGSGSGGGNPAARRILSDEEDTPAADTEMQQQRFHAIAIEAKLRHPGQPFQQSIESLFELSQQQGVPEEDWPQFIESRIASWHGAAS